MGREGEREVSDTEAVTADHGAVAIYTIAYLTQRTFPGMRRLLLIFLLPLTLSAQDMGNSVGLVTISDKYDSTDHKIEFLNDDGSIWYTLDLYKAWENKSDFRIVAFKPDYFLLHIRCIERTSARYTVVVNEETGLKKFLLNSSKLKFQTWEEYVINEVFSIELDPANAKIYDQINGTILTDIPEQGKVLAPKEVKGEWMRIIWSDTNEYPSNTSNDRTGWIRWRKDDKIIVTLFHLS